MNDLNLIDKLKLFYKYHITPNPAHSPVKETKLGLIALKLNLKDYYSRLLSFSKDFNVERITSINYKQKELPIYSIETSPRKTSKRLLITAGIHGNEYAGPLAVLEILSDIKKNPETYENIKINFLTPVNPVGILNLSRYNADGTDINRDFSRFKTQEAKAVRRKVESFKPDFVLDLHEGPQDEGAFIYTHQHAKSDAATLILELLERRNIPLATKDYFGRSLKRNGLAELGKIFSIIERSWDVCLSMRPFASYTSSLGIPSIAIESSWRSDNQRDRIDTHVYTVKAIVKYLSSQK